MQRLVSILLACLALGLVTATLAGCLPRSVIVNQMADVVADGIAAWETDADLDLVEKAMPAQIKLAETLAAAEPADPGPLLLSARLYGAYGLLFAQTRLEAEALKASLPPAIMAPGARADWQAAASRYFDRGAGFALKALERRHPDASRRMVRPETAETFFQSLGTPDVPALFWYGFNLGAYIHHNRDRVEAVSRLYLAKGAMERVIALAPEYNHGMAHLVMMVIWGALPPSMGGQPLKAQDHFRQAVALNGGRLKLADVYHARYVLQPLQQRREFADALNAVVQDWDKDPRLRLYNRLAQVRASIYLQAIDRLFLEE